MPTTTPHMLTDGRLADAPSTPDVWFERDREWLICRSMTGSVSAALFFAIAGCLLLAMAIGFIAHTRTNGNPPARQATGEMVVMLMVAPFLLVIVLSAFLSLPGERTVAFSPSEVRVTRRIASWCRHRHAMIEQCARLRVLDRPSWADNPGVQRQRMDPGRLAFDLGKRTIRFAGGLSDSEAWSVHRFLVASIPRFASSHERS